MELSFSLKHFQELSLSELYEIMTLRQDVFVVEQNCPYLDTDGKDLQAYHLMGRNGEGKLVCYARLLDEGVSYKGFCSIGRVINAREVRRQGVGKELMTRAIRHITELYPLWPVKIGAQSYLKTFYESFGFMDMGVPYLEDGIPHMEMILDKK